MTCKCFKTPNILKNTINDKCVIGEIILSEVFAWIDASDAVHLYRRSVMGGAMSMG